MNTPGRTLILVLTWGIPIWGAFHAVPVLAQDESETPVAEPAPAAEGGFCPLDEGDGSVPSEPQAVESAPSDPIASGGEEATPDGTLEPGTDTLVAVPGDAQPVGPEVQAAQGSDPIDLGSGSGANPDPLSQDRASSVLADLQAQEPPAAQGAVADGSSGQAAESPAGSIVRIDRVLAQGDTSKIEPFFASGNPPSVCTGDVCPLGNVDSDGSCEGISVAGHLAMSGDLPADAIAHPQETAAGLMAASQNVAQNGSDIVTIQNDKDPANVMQDAGQEIQSKGSSVIGFTFGHAVLGTGVEEGYARDVDGTIRPATITHVWDPNPPSSGDRSEDYLVTFRDTGKVMLSPTMSSKYQLPQDQYFGTGEITNMQVSQAQNQFIQQTVLPSSGFYGSTRTSQPAR